MGTVATNTDYSSLYASNYVWNSNGKNTLESWFTVSVGKNIYTYNFPPGLVQSLYPDQITEKASPNWNGTSILNKAGQLWSFSGTSDRAYSFSFDLAADAFVEYSGGNLSYQTTYTLNSSNQYADPKSTALNLNATNSSATQFDDFVNGLKRTVYSDYEEDIMFPPLTTFCFGSFKVRGFVQGITFTWKKPIIDGKYSKLNVSIEMVQLLNTGKTVNDIITGSYIQGTSAYNIGGI